jgi:pseudo-rSAM protein
MNKKKINWVSLEPFVHGVVKDGHVLLYNTVNKKHLIFSGISEIAEIVNQLIDPLNGYVCALEDDQMKSPVIRKFIEQLRKKYMGDIYLQEWATSKPFNIFPEPVIKKGSNILEHNLSEITFHLSTGHEKQLEQFRNASNQFIFPIYSDDLQEELSPDILRAVSIQTASLSVATINFVISNKLNAKTLDELSNVFTGKSFRRKFYLLLNQLDLDCSYILKKHDWLSLYITFPIEQLQIEKLNALLLSTEDSRRVECYFIVQKSDDVEMSMKIITQLSIKQPFFKPYFNGENLKFFEDHVFITGEDLMLSRPSQNQIFSRVTMNENDYGKLHILPGGNVLANMNDEPLGNLNTESLENLIQKELGSGKSWKRMRTAVEPCKECIFQFICPPVSNYEIYLNRFNFCHIHP